MLISPLLYIQVQDMRLPYHRSRRHSSWFKVEAFWLLFLWCRLRSSLGMLIILRIFTIFLSHSWRMQVHVTHTTARFLVLNSFTEGIILWHSKLNNWCSWYRNVRVNLAYSPFSFIIRIVCGKEYELSSFVYAIFLTPFLHSLVLGTFIYLASPSHVWIIILLKY